MRQHLSYPTFRNAVSVTQANQITGQGIIGLGPFTGSQVQASVGSSDGDPVLNRIFGMNTSLPSVVTFTLERSEDPNVPLIGELTVGEYIPGLENVTSQPKIPVPLLTSVNSSSQHWSIGIDAVIGPDGKQISLPPTTVQGQTKPVAVLDSGFTFPQVPKAVSDSIYSGIKGAQYNSSQGSWILPCDQEINISFVIGGVTYPIHPLDTNFASTNDDGSVTCIGSVSIVLFIY